MVASAEVLRICDRFVYCAPDSALNENNLPRIAVVLVLLYIVMAIAIVHLAGIEHKHPRLVPVETDISFEMEEPKLPPPPPKLPDKPEQTKNIDVSNGGAKPAPAPKAQEEQPAAVQAPDQTAQQNLNTTQVNSPVQETRPAAEQPAVAKPTAIAALPPTAPSPVSNAENTQQTSGTQATGGNPNGSGTGNGNENGTGGQGTGTEGNGTGSGAPGNGGPPAPPKMGNIAPYRRDLLLRISHTWHPKRKTESLVLLLTLAHDGSILQSRVEQSTGDDNADTEALTAIASTPFAPLPDWYHGDKLTFRINMDKVEKLQLQNN